MRTPLRMALSAAVGWAAEREIPTRLRARVYSAYARLTGADLSEARDPLASYPSLGAFFVRHLKDGARTIDPDPRALVSPVDGTVQSVGPVTLGSVLQAKGRPYTLRQMLDGPQDGIELDGGTAWTLYLSPRDYHRIHAPLDVRLWSVRWCPGARYSVAPAVLERRLVLPINERAVLRLESARGVMFLVLVGALNVGKIRIVGVEPGRQGWIDPALPFAKGSELARFEMGSTIVLITPRGMAQPLAGLAPGDPVRLGQRIGGWT